MAKLKPVKERYEKSAPGMCRRCGWPLGEGMAISASRHILKGKSLVLEDIPGMQHYSTPYCTSLVLSKGFGPGAHPLRKKSLEKEYAEAGLKIPKPKKRKK